MTFHNFMNRSETLLWVILKDERERNIRVGPIFIDSNGDGVQCSIKLHRYGLKCGFEEAKRVSSTHYWDGCRGSSIITDDNTFDGHKEQRGISAD
jgi:hypothetical protein